MAYKYSCGQSTTPLLCEDSGVSLPRSMPGIFTCKLDPCRPSPDDNKVQQTASLLLGCSRKRSKLKALSDPVARLHKVGEERGRGSAFTRLGRREGGAVPSKGWGGEREGQCLAKRRVLSNALHHIILQEGVCYHMQYIWKSDSGVD